MIRGVSYIPHSRLIKGLSQRLIAEIRQPGAGQLLLLRNETSCASHDLSRCDLSNSKGETVVDTRTDFFATGWRAVQAMREATECLATSHAKLCFCRFFNVLRQLSGRDCQGCCGCSVQRLHRASGTSSIFLRHLRQTRHGVVPAALRAAVAGSVPFVRHRVGDVVNGVLEHPKTPPRLEPTPT